MGAEQPRRIVILTGTDSVATCRSIEALCRESAISIGGILFDRNPQTIKKAWKNLRRNIAREGYRYIGYRLFVAIRDGLESLANIATPQSAASEILQSAFPEESWSIRDLATRKSIPFFEVDNMNSAAAAETVRGLNADLAVVLGTRILKPSVFNIPRLGAINLHKGKVPEFRGMPPGFWELYEGVKTAGVTIHFVDAGLDTGDIVAERTVNIHPKDTPRTLKAKLDKCAVELLPAAVKDVLSGTATPRRQPPGTGKPRRAPTRRQIRELYARLGIELRHEKWTYIAKLAYHIVVFASGTWKLARWLRRCVNPSWAAVLLYHRVNDECFDVLTTSRLRFAQHIAVLKRYYKIISSEELVSKLQRGESLPRDALCIHFDDCYEDVFSNAARILSSAQVPASAFVSSGFVGTRRRFQHDISKYPLWLANMSREQVATLRSRGVAVQSHTVNHSNLAECDADVLEYELAESKRQLELITQRAVTQFSFPFGRKENTHPELASIASKVGYQAVFSAYGGRVQRKTDLMDIPRFGVDDEFTCLNLQLEIEGLSAHSLMARLR